MAFLDQWRNNDLTTDRDGFVNVITALDKAADRECTHYFVQKYFILLDWLNLLLFYRAGLVGSRNKLYWWRMRLQNKYPSDSTLSPLS